MRRGFKSEAERAALAARRALRLPTLAPLDPWAYAKHLGIVLLDFNELKLPAKAVDQLLRKDPDSWSAMTLKKDGVLAVIINPKHAKTRQCSDLMHETAHIELRHVPSRVEVFKPTGMLLLSDYSEEQEHEADWWAAAMLLPREALYRSRRLGKDVSEIALDFGLSEALVDWRLKMTGVDIQMRRASQG